MSALTPSPGDFQTQQKPPKSPKSRAQGQRAGQTHQQHPKLGHGLRIRAGVDAELGGGRTGGTHPRAAATFPELGIIPGIKAGQDKSHRHSPGLLRSTEPPWWEHTGNGNHH